MAQPIPLVKDDYNTPIVFHAQALNKALPLVGATVVFDFIEKKTNRRIGGGNCEIIDQNQGLAKYLFKGNELSVPGEYQGKVKIQLPQGASRVGPTLDFQIS